MDEATLAAKMMEMAKAEMKYVNSKGLIGENPNWGKPQEKVKKEKRSNGAGKAI